MKELIAIQQELKAPKNQTNKFGGYNYRSCEDILEAVKPLLAKHDCVLTLADTIHSVDNVPQMVITDESTKPKTKSLSVGSLVYVEATATISCGDVVHAVTAQAAIDVNKAGMDYAQSFGASSSYARKYALNGLFLIDDTKDADSTNTHGKSEPEKPESSPAPTTSSDKISEAQGKRLFAICKTSGTPIAEVANKFGFKKVGEISKSNYEDVCKWAEVGYKVEMVKDVMDEDDDIPF